MGPCEKMLTEALAYIQREGWAPGRGAIVDALFKVSPGVDFDTMERTLGLIALWTNDPQITHWDEQPGRTQEEVEAMLAEVALLARAHGC